MAGSPLLPSEEHFRLLVESVQDYAIFMLDPSGRVATWNLGAQRMKGYQPDEIVGQHFTRFYTAEDRERGWPAHELSVARTVGRFEDEGWRLRKDGSRFWANVVITALFDRAGALVGFAKVTRDLTERRKAESLAEEGRRMHEFLAMLGHELRNPLAPIRNAAEIIRLRESGDAKIRWARDIIERQTAHLSRLVDDLLDVGRITTGKVALVREPVDLAQVVNSAVELARPLMVAKRHQLDVHISEGPHMLDGDAVRLTQVVSNLLGNAAKYTGEGGHVRVRLDHDGDWEQLQVIDDGVGMPGELVPRVFELFTQGERSLARAEGGLGIGLTLVRRLVLLHGGSVSASSGGLGQGSTFVVRLPRQPELRPAVTPPGGERAPVEPPRVRVLVVDDNRDSAEAVAALLELWGYAVTMVHDGPAALAAAAAQPPAVVLLDIGLPGMDGYQVAAKLQAAPQPVPVLIAMTGYGQPDDRERTHAAGFAEHLVKPVLPERLRSALSAALAGA